MITMLCVVIILGDLSLWTETDGAIEWLKAYMVEAELEPPQISEAKAIEATEDQSILDLHEMFLDMFKTGSELIEERLTGSAANDEEE